MIHDDAFEPDRPPPVPETASEQPPLPAPADASGVPAPSPELVEWELDVQDPLPWAVEEDVPSEPDTSGISVRTPEASAPPAPLTASAPPPLSLRSPLSPFQDSSLSRSPAVPPNGDSHKAGSSSASTSTPTIEQILEAMLFVGGPPLTAATAASAIRGLTEERFHQALQALNRRYRQQKRPYAIVPREEGFVLTLLPSYLPLRERLYGGPRTLRLSQATLDVLAIVAYRQPVTKAEVDALRGQESGPQLRQLLRLGFITMLHRGESLPTPNSEPSAVTPPSAEQQASFAPDSSPAYSPNTPLQPDTPTRAARYGTTPRFLRFFGLTSLDDLPRLATDI